MQAHAILHAASIDAVLFDCDGVLADSEVLSIGILADDLSARGMTISHAQAAARFTGCSLPEIARIVRADPLWSRLAPLPAGWARATAGVMAERSALEVEAIEGSLDVLAALLSEGVPVAVASNSSRAELSAKLGRLGLIERLSGRIFSFEDVERPKPAPDLYLAAAAACGAEPGRCLVVEDSVAGAKAGVAAGCRVIGFCRDTPAAALEAAGVSALFDDFARFFESLGRLAPARP